MTDQDHNKGEKPEENVPYTEPETSEQAAEQEASTEPETAPHDDALAEKRGRMVAAGAVTAVILSAIAVLVAGVFHLTSRWMATCPRDLPVNDPAPILWKDLTAQKESVGSLGVPDGVASQTGLKIAVPESK